MFLSKHCYRKIRGLVVARMNLAANWDSRSLRRRRAREDISFSKVDMDRDAYGSCHRRGEEL